MKDPFYEEFDDGSVGTWKHFAFGIGAGTAIATTIIIGAELFNQRDVVKTKMKKRFKKDDHTQ